MFRYVAFAWTVADATATAASRELAQSMGGPGSQWRNALEVPGLSVFCTGESARSNQAHVLNDSQGVVLGTVFERGDPAGGYSRARFDQAATLRIASTRGRDLIERYWGRYVAFLADRDSDTKWVIRDPGGELDCLHTSFRGVNIFRSFLEDCPVLERLTFSVNWDFVATVIAVSTSEGHHTGLNEVTRVLSGECAQISDDQMSRSFYWHPFEVVASRSIEDPAAAAAELRLTTASCTHAWASCYDRILNCLSGGLDSSIVLGCLASAPTRPSVTNWNVYHAPSSGGDERAFARLAAQRAGFALLEHEADAQVDVRQMYDIPKSVQPLASAMELGTLAGRRRVCKELQIEGIFRGCGGDQLFFQNGSRFACPDYIFSHGVRPALLRVALDAASMEGELMWELLTRGLREARVHPLSLLLADVKLMDVLAPDAAERVRRSQLYLHPWFHSTVRVPAGKFWQTYGLSGPYGMSNSFGRPEDPDDVHPLMSQPVVELCLQIPTYVLATSGIDRALARQAFSREVPAPILRRRIKGNTYLYPRALYARNRELVREILLNGDLVREGVLERARLERILNDEPGASDLAGPAVLLTLASAEVWLQKWTRQQWKAAA